MSTKKYLHVKDGVIKAVSLPGEQVVLKYGTLVEVGIDAPYGVGDNYPAEPEAKPAKKAK